MALHQRVHTHVIHIFIFSFVGFFIRSVDERACIPAHSSSVQPKKCSRLLKDATKAASQPSACYADTPDRHAEGNNVAAGGHPVSTATACKCDAFGQHQLAHRPGSLHPCALDQ